MAFDLSSLLEKARGLVQKREGSVLGIDAGSSAIKIVQLRKEKGQAVLETYGAIALGPYAGVEIGRATNLPVEKLGEALNDVLREGNATTRNCGISIPYSASLISLIKMPAVSEQQLKDMVPLEARKYIPVPIAEVMLDWFVVPKEESDPEKGKKEDVLLVAIHKDTLNKYQSLINLSSLAASFFEIEVFSTARASLGPGIQPVAVLDMGAATTKLYVVERGIVRESHILNHGGQELTLAIASALGITVMEAEEIKRTHGLLPSGGEKLRASAESTLNYLLSEVNRSILSFQQRTSKTIATVVITGGGATLKGLPTLMQTKLAATVERADPFGKTRAPAFLQDVLAEIGPEFSVAVGLALRKLQEGA
jgi:type IV pilus assembly protein PilM